MRGTSLPSASLRWPFSMGWVISVLISITSPFLALAGTRRRGLMSSDTMFSRSAAAAADGDLDLAAPRVERAVVHPGHRDQFLALGPAEDAPHLGLAPPCRELVNGRSLVGD